MSESETRLYDPVIHIPADFFADIEPLNPEFWDELVWQPPRTGQFTELEASDECWARFLGLGRLVGRMELFRERLDRKIIEGFGIPPKLLFASNPGSSYAASKLYDRLK